MSLSSLPERERGRERKRGGGVGRGSPQDLKDLHVLGALFGLGQDLGFKLLNQLSQSFILRFRKSYAIDNKQCKTIN